MEVAQMGDSAFIRRTRILESRMHANVPVRFGKGRREKARQRDLARRLLHGTIRPVRNLNTLTYLIINARALNRAKTINRGLLLIN